MWAININYKFRVLNYIKLTKSTNCEFDNNKGRTISDAASLLFPVVPGQLFERGPVEPARVCFRLRFAPGSASGTPWLEVIACSDTGHVPDLDYNPADRAVVLGTRTSHI